jgi:threonylcarbamoyladenosine tRNA methylthiotransferase MtaB
MKGVEVVTFGCRLNAFESEVISGEAESADINSCAVTNEAVAQARQSIRRIKRARLGSRPNWADCVAKEKSVGCDEGRPFRLEQPALIRRP